MRMYQPNALPRAALKRSIANMSFIIRAIRGGSSCRPQNRDDAGDVVPISRARG
jgi:hypothetical protein